MRFSVFACAVLASVGIAVVAIILAGVSIDRTPAKQTMLPTLIWFAPFLSGGGYSSEAISFALGLHSRGRAPIRIAHHGDSVSREFLFGLDDAVSSALRQMLRAAVDHSRPFVVVCHSEPGAAWRIGRTMSETDEIPAEWTRRCNEMDEIWVPTEFHREVFGRSGVDPAKIVVIPEPVDTSMFNEKVQPIPEIVGLGKTRFLCVAKWEERKAFDLLVRAFAMEFSSEENATLVVLTHEFHHDGIPIEDAVREIARSVKPIEMGPRIFVLQEYIPDSEMPRLYRSVHALLVPSRGEGWGRPHVEAMACGVPVVATNWSGPTAFMTEGNSFPLQIEGLVHPKTGPFQAFQWAQPSFDHLRKLMRLISMNPEEAMKRGAQARIDIERYNLETVADIVLERLAKITEVKKLF